MKKAVFYRIALLYVFCFSIQTQAEARIFTDIEGRTIEAELVSIFRNEVTFGVPEKNANLPFLK